MVKTIFTTTFVGLLLLAQSATAKDIIHDAEQGNVFAQYNLAVVAR